MYTRGKDRQYCVFDSRVKKIQRALADNNLDYLFIPSGINQRYVSGLKNKKRERLYAVIIPKDGKVKIVCPSFELEREKDHLRLSTAEFLTWDEDPYSKVAKIIHKDSPKIGLDPKAWFAEYARLKKSIPSASITDAGVIFTRLRLLKDDWEKEKIEEAISINDEAREAMFSQLQKGMSESEAVAKFVYEALSRGGRKPHPHAVSLGSNTSVPHSVDREAYVREGTVIRVDSGVYIGGYRGDVTRMAVFGTPPSKFRKAFEVVVKAQQAAFNSIKPGVTPETVDKAAREVIQSAGFGQYFTHRLGHGIGMDIHEPPWISKGQKEPLERGMVFTVEPGIYFPQKYGVRLEDNVIVTEEGCELLSDPVTDFRCLS